MNQKRVEVIMGISGCGKTRIGTALAKATATPFLDADDFHPRENIMKMSRGLPLTDDDRWPWLAALVEFIKNNHRDHFVLACSALKDSYRQYLAQGLDCRFFVLKIDRSTAIERINKRESHFMKSDLVDSQLQTLELTADLNLLDGTDDPAQIIHAIRQKMK